MNPAHDPLAPFEAALQALRADPARADAAVRRLRAAAVPAALPPRFAEVLHTLLDRLEASASFSGESCSFSQADLLAGLQAWIDAARQRLAG